VLAVAVALSLSWRRSSRLDPLRARTVTPIGIYARPRLSQLFINIVSTRLLLFASIKSRMFTKTAPTSNKHPSYLLHSPLLMRLRRSECREKTRNHEFRTRAKLSISQRSFTRPLQASLHHHVTLSLLSEDTQPFYCPHRTHTFFASSRFEYNLFSWSGHSFPWVTVRSPPTSNRKSIRFVHFCFIFASFFSQTAPAGLNPIDKRCKNRIRGPVLNVHHLTTLIF